MLRSRSQRLLFVHIQKTGGNSIARVMQNSIADLEPYLRPHDPLILAESDLGAEYEAHFKAAFVRNPFDRLVSWYAMISSRGARLSQAEKLARPDHNRIWQYVLERASSFDEFVRHCADATDRSGWKPFQFNQVDYLRNSRGTIDADFIGRFETLPSDAATLFKRIGMPATPLPHLNASDHGDYRHYYTDETRRIVESRFAEDLEYFRYEF